jgi:FkbM family methyltransferase
MPPSPALVRVLRKLVADAPLVYVDCGARRGKLPRWLQPIPTAQYIGFEADAEECARLNASGRREHRYIPVFLGRDVERRTFFATRSAACSSLLRPNLPLLNAFPGLAPLFEVERTIDVETVSLDRCLEVNGVPLPDFLELDTQGTELEILEGSVQALRNSVVGVQVEVEFAPMYAGQPLFADVDAFLRHRGFELFDVSRFRARRGTLPAGVPTRGQLLWGHALYLRDYRTLPSSAAMRLGVMSVLLDRPDLAAEIFAAMPEDSMTPSAARAVASARRLMNRTARWRRLSAGLARLGSRLQAFVEPHEAAAGRGYTTWRD